MLKKIGLLLFVATLSLVAQSKPTPNQILEHIAQTKKDIMLEMQLALTMNQKVTNHFQALLESDYESIKSSCFKILNIIITSSEFVTTVEQVTDEQMDLIINQMVNYNDIIIDPSAYPLEQKIQNELAAAAFDEKTEQLFNVLYVVFATIHGSKKLLEKLIIKENELRAELELLKAQIQSVTP